jgi:hypothetical protein
MGLPLAKMWTGVNWFEVETAWATPEKLVGIPLRDDGNPSRQQSLEWPEIIGQPQGHSRRPVVRAKYALPNRQQPHPMNLMKVVIEERPRPRVHRRLASRLAKVCNL